MTLSKLTAEWIAVNETNIGDNMDLETQMSHLDCDKEISRLRNQLHSWRTAFKHAHKNNSINDACATCGLDLRDDIHIRLVGKVDEIGDYIARVISVIEQNKRGDKIPMWVLFGHLKESIVLLREATGRNG